MKKFLVMFAIAGALVSCNNSSENKDTTADSLRRDSIMRDSMDKANAMMNQNTMPAGDTSANKMTMGDSSANKMTGDTTHK